MFTRPSAVIFDMDGLMLDTERLARKAWLEAAGRFDVSISDDVYFSLVGRNQKDGDAILSQALGPDVPLPDLKTTMKEIYTGYIETDGLPTKPGLYELIDFLETTDFRKAVATSTSRPLALRKLEKVNLLNRFETLTGGDEIAHGKPAPDIFIETGRKLGLPLTECIVLEDSPNGIRAAHSAGARPVMIPDLLRPTPELHEKSEIILDSLHQVPDFLQGIQIHEIATQ